MQRKIADGFLFNASESQLRNVLSMASRSIPDAEFIALVQREAKMAAKEAKEVAFAKAYIHLLDRLGV